MWISVPRRGSDNGEKGGEGGGEKEASGRCWIQWGGLEMTADGNRDGGRRDIPQGDRGIIAASQHA